MSTPRTSTCMLLHPLCVPAGLGEPLALLSAVWSIKQKNTQYYAVGRNSGGRAQATHTYGARPMESRKLMTAAACITEVASANTMAEDMAARWCARYVLGDVLDVP